MFCSFISRMRKCKCLHKHVCVDCVYVCKKFTKVLNIVSQYNEGELGLVKQREVDPPLQILLVSMTCSQHYPK